MSPTVLITGATGRHGNTGEQLVSGLLNAGCEVRVLARRETARTRTLADAGARVILGDLHDRRTLVPALQNADLAYFVYPIDAGVVDAAANYAAAVRELDSTVRTVVMSMGPAHSAHPSALGRAQWLAEEVLQWAGLDVCILRVAALFHQNIAVLHATSIRESGVLRNCFGSGRVPWIGGRDVADLALAALLHPSAFGPGPVHFIAGVEDVSHAEIADELTALLGSPVAYQPITATQWREELVDLADRDHTGTVNAAMAQHISAVADQIARGGAAMAADPERIRRLTGRPPERLTDYLSASVDVFRRSS